MLFADRIHEIMPTVLYKDEDIVDGLAPEGALLVRGLVHTFGLVKEKIEPLREEIKGYLGEFSENFMKSGGGGASFLHFAVTKDDRQWADGHLAMEALMVLGMALGYVSYCCGRELWSVLPGGVPYIVIDLNAPPNPLLAESKGGGS